MEDRTNSNSASGWEINFEVGKNSNLSQGTMSDSNVPCEFQAKYRVKEEFQLQGRDSEGSLPDQME